MAASTHLVKKPCPVVPPAVTRHPFTAALKINELGSHNFPPCMLDEVSSTWRELMVARRRCETVSAKLLGWEQSLIYSFCLTLIPQLWSGHFPTAGTGMFPRAEKSIWNRGWGGVEVFRIFYCAVSCDCVSAFFYSLWFNWSSGKTAAQPVTCAESWADSFQRWFVSDRISLLSDLWSLSRYDHAKANGREGKLQLLERGRARRRFTWWGAFSDHVVITRKFEKAFIFAVCSSPRENRSQWTREITSHISSSEEEYFKLNTYRKEVVL